MTNVLLFIHLCKDFVLVFQTQMYFKYSLQVFYLVPTEKWSEEFLHLGNNPPQHPLVQTSPILGTLNTITLHPSVQGREPGHSALTTPEVWDREPASQAGFDPEHETCFVDCWWVMDEWEKVLQLVKAENQGSFLNHLPPPCQIAPNPQLIWKLDDTIPSLFSKLL